MTNERLREQIAALDAGDGGPWEAGYAAAIKDVLALMPSDESEAEYRCHIDGPHVYCCKHCGAGVPVAWPSDVVTVKRQTEPKAKCVCGNPDCASPRPADVL